MHRPEHLDAILTRGYTVIEGVLSSAEIAEGRAALDAVFRNETEAGVKNGWHNAIYTASYMLARKHPFFWSLCQRPPMLTMVRELLGPDCILSSTNGLSMVPGSAGQALHIDHPQSTPGFTLTVNVTHTLDDFTRRNGATRVVPGSHHRVWTGRPEDIAAAEREAVSIEAPAGSLIAFDGAIWHGGSRNETAAGRRAVHVLFARRWVKPEWDFPRSLPLDVAASLTDEQRQLFGYTSRPSRYDAEHHREVQDDPAPPDRHPLLSRLLQKRTP